MHMQIISQGNNIVSETQNVNKLFDAVAECLGTFPISERL